MRHYLKDENLKIGDIIYFEMPSFCSGEYFDEIGQDSKGFFIDSPYFEKCYGYRINKPYYKTLNPITLEYED